MLVNKTIDLFKTNANVLVNPVNTKGVSGCGLAKQFKLKYPSMQTIYENACHVGFVSLGDLYLISHRILTEEDLEQNPNLKYIVCFPTKQAPSRKEKTSLEVLEQGLKKLKYYCNTYFLPDWSIAVPMLGCGAGGLKCQDVEPLISRVLGSPDIKQKIVLCRS